MKSYELEAPYGPILNPSVYLTKYLPEKYDSIKVGTLDGFRKMEGNQGDKLDGKIEGIEISGEASFTSDEFNQTARNSNFQVHATGGIRFGKEGRFRDVVSRVATNCYVYCVSMETAKPPNKGRIDHFSASCFGIVHDPEAFAVHIADGLKDGRHQNGTRFDRDRLGCRYWYAPVRYISRQQPRVNELNNLDLFIYQKDPIFMLEQEFRFCWAVFDKHTNEQVYVHPDPVFLEMPNDSAFSYYDV